MDDENSEIKLTEKQEAYCFAYIICGNKSQAYREAYDAEVMNANTVNRSAFELHNNPKITARIKQLQNEAKERNKITLDEIVNITADIARFDISQLYDENDTLKSIQDIPEEARSAILGIEVLEEYQGSGKDRELIGFTKKVRVINKLDAIEKLMKYLGGYEKDNKQKTDTLRFDNISTEELIKRAKAIKTIDEQA